MFTISSIVLLFRWKITLDSSNVRHIQFYRLETELAMWIIIFPENRRESSTLKQYEKNSNFLLLLIKNTRILRFVMSRCKTIACCI